MANPNLSLETVLSPAFRRIWDNSLLGVMVLDDKGLVKYINRLLIQTDDLQELDILGQPMVDFYPLEKERHLSIQTLESGRPIIKKTVLYYTHLNKLVNSLCSTFPLHSNDRIEGVIHFSLNLQISESLIEQHQGRDRPPVGKGKVGRPQPRNFESLIGRSETFINAVTYAKAASKNDLPAMIWAETGCGKELFAQSMHLESDRRDGPFIPINCAAIPDNLLEATLFGTAKGAFTGAVEKPGLLENAQGGTLLLDELNSMSLELQAKLLRVVQEKRLRRVGALREIPIDVKFISTCNIPPVQALEKNLLRLDLFYRLAAVVIEIPPLRRRISDIPLLYTRFLERWSSRTGRPPAGLSPTVEDMFLRYPWPGNVRELEHTIDSSLGLLTDGRIIHRRHLSSYFRENYRRLVERTGGEPEPGPGPSVGESGHPVTVIQGSQLAPQPRPGGDNICLTSTLRDMEKGFLEQALVRAGYNISKAGRYLNLSPQNMRYRIKKLGLTLPDE